MLKIIRFEIAIIGILFLYIFVSHNLNLHFYNYSSHLRDNLQQIYIKSFFENITIIGNSLWYFLTCIGFIIIYYSLKKSIVLNKHINVIEKIKYFNFLLFSSILCSGILTQIIKHVLGRPRPNTLIFENEISLRFLSTDSDFHSFPSGHTTTIFAVALVISLIAPKLKYFFYFLAIVVSFSRVVVGAHYITDIIGGIIVAFIGFKFSKLILNTIFNTNEKHYKVPIVNDNFKLIIFAFLLLSVFLGLGPSLDIFFSNLFYLGENQFLVQSLDYISVFSRKIILGLILFYLLVLPIFSILLPLKQIYFGYHFKIKEVLYIWMVTLLGLVVFINVIAKNIWGRARPNEVLELGGKNLFSPWYQISDQCISNCSFVSGDAAVGFSLVVFYFLIKKEIYLWFALFFGLAIGIIRIMEGGHFISDIIFSCLIVFLFNSLIYSYYSKKVNE